MKLLIVDDKKEDLYLLETLLKGSGYEVVSAGNGVEALEKLEKDSIDMIISDILMPKMDGFQLCRKCKSNHELRKIPFLFYSATYTDKRDEEFALSLGAEKFITKPVEPNVFLSILEGVIKEYEKGALVVPQRPIEKETVYLSLYNERLIKKLEKKMVDLEKTDKVLRESEQKYRQLVNNANDAVIIIDPEGYFSFVNPKFCQMTGYAIEEARRLHFNKLVHPKDSAMVTKNFKKRLSGEETRGHYEFRGLTKLGKTIYVDYNSTVIQREGRIVGIQAVIRDITEHKRAEEQIRASLKEKEVLVREIHHRVKNNLQVISSLLDLSSLRIHDQQAISFLTNAQSKIYTMALIHSQLYETEEFNQIEMGSHIQTITRYLTQVYSEAKRITPVIEIPEFYLSITQAIPCALVLNELISNALQHAFQQEQKGTIEISMQRSATGTVFIKVKDDGIGMSDKVDIYTTDSLGLKLVRNLVQKQLKGEIQLKRDKGTEFTVKFKVLGSVKTFIKESRKNLINKGKNPPYRGGKLS